MARHHSGKTPAGTILLRIFLWLSMPIWSFYLIFGFPWVNKVGQIDYDRNTEPSTRWTVFFDTAQVFVAWYAGIGGALFWMYVAQHGICNFLWNGESDYDTWKERGGDIFFDSLEGPFNNDSDEIRRATPPPLPPNSNCPRCGGDFTLNNGYQCGNCFLYWDGQTWWEPTAGYFEGES